MDISIMYHLHINPHELSDDDWITAYVGVKEILKEKAKQNKAQK